MGEGERRSQTGDGVQAQRYARAAGVLIIASLVAGGLGEYLLPTSLITFADPAGTVRNVVGSNLLFRVGFAAYLVEAVCDVSLTLALYVLLRPVDPPMALLAAFFRLIGTALFAVSELFYFSALVILSGAAYLSPFSVDQLQALAMLALRLYASSGIFAVFHGLGAVLVGWLIARSGYLPRPIGVIFAASGVVFVAQSFVTVLGPGIPVGPLVALAAGVAAIALASWCLARGVDVPKWEAASAHML